jgi:hypothetical protein
MGRMDVLLFGCNSWTKWRSSFLQPLPVRPDFLDSCPDLAHELHQGFGGIDLSKLILFIDSEGRLCHDMTDNASYSGGMQINVYVSELLLKCQKACLQCICY